MLDSTFQRRREMEHMLLAGQRLTVSKMMIKYGVGRKSISRDFEIIGEELPIMTKKGYNGGYFRGTLVPYRRGGKIPELTHEKATGMSGKNRCCLYFGR